MQMQPLPDTASELNYKNDIGQLSVDTAHASCLAWWCNPEYLIWQEAIEARMQSVLSVLVDNTLLKCACTVSLGRQSFSSNKLL